MDYFEVWTKTKDIKTHFMCLYVKHRLWPFLFSLGRINESMEFRANTNKATFSDALPPLHSVFDLIEGKERLRAISQFTVLLNFFLQRIPHTYWMVASTSDFRTTRPSASNQEFVHIWWLGSWGHVLVPHQISHLFKHIDKVFQKPSRLHVGSCIEGTSSVLRH